MFMKSKIDFLGDTTDHLWRSASAMPPKAPIPGDYMTIVTRSMFLLIVLAELCLPFLNTSPVPKPPHKFNVFENKN